MNGVDMIHQRVLAVEMFSAVTTDRRGTVRRSKVCHVRIIRLFVIREGLFQRVVEGLQAGFNAGFCFGDFFNRR